MHVDSWQNIWQTGNIFLDGPNLELAKVVHGSLFYLLSSLPDEPVNAQRRRFSGLSPGGLANGGYLKDYQGHSFWGYGDVDVSAGACPLASYCKRFAVVPHD